VQVLQSGPSQPTLYINRVSTPLCDVLGNTGTGSARHLYALQRDGDISEKIETCLNFVFFFPLNIFRLFAHLL
jgi:hypothetical protein